MQLLRQRVPHAIRVPAGSARTIQVSIGATYDGFAREMSHLHRCGAPLDAVVETAAGFGVHLAWVARRARVRSAGSRPRRTVYSTAPRRCVVRTYAGVGYACVS